MSQLNVLVSGSGIASNVYAYWLLRAYPKANITIVERSPSPRLTGSSIDIRNLAVDITKWMGVEPEIRKQGSKESGIRFVQPNGKVVGILGASGRADAQSLTSEYEIYRAELVKIFSDKIEGRVEFVYDECVESFQQRDDESGVDVTFAKSKEVKTYDLLVAADGFSSKIRGMMLNTKSSEQIYDEGVHVAYFTMKNNLLKGSNIATWCNSTRGRVIFLRPNPANGGCTSALLLNVTTSKDVETKEKLNTAAREGNESYMKVMEELFHDAGGQASEVLKNMRESDDFYCSLFGQIRSPRIADGRVVLIGDAAYAKPGFGTSLAIMGAYALAGELLNHPGDVKAATNRYEEVMLPFVKSTQGDDGAMQYLNPQTEWGLTIRNSILGFVTWAMLDRLAIAVVSMLGFAESKPPIPDYPWPEEERTD